MCELSVCPHCSRIDGWRCWEKIILNSFSCEAFACEVLLFKTTPERRPYLFPSLFVRLFVYFIVCVCLSLSLFFVAFFNCLFMFVSFLFCFLCLFVQFVTLSLLCSFLNFVLSFFLFIFSLFVCFFCIVCLSVSSLFRCCLSFYVVFVSLLPSYFFSLFCLPLYSSPLLCPHQEWCTELMRFKTLRIWNLWNCRIAGVRPYRIWIFVCIVLCRPMKDNISFFPTVEPRVWSSLCDRSG